MIMVGTSDFTVGDMTEVTESLLEVDLGKVQNKVRI